MHRLVFISVLGVTLVASAHDNPAACSESDTPAADTASGPVGLAPGAVLRRGAPLPKGGTPVSLTQVLAKPEDGRSVLVEGVVRRACSHRGCWMELAPPEGGPGVRVTFKNYGFFVPTDSAGARARVQGTLKISALTPAKAEHLRSEGASVAAGAEREVQLVASGVELRRP